MTSLDENTYKQLFALFHENSKNKTPYRDLYRSQLRDFLEKFFINFTNSQNKPLINHIIGLIILEDVTLINNNDKYEKSMIFLKNIKSSDPTNIVNNIMTEITQIIQKVQEIKTAEALNEMKTKRWSGGPHFDGLRQPLESHFAFSHPSFIRTYIGFLDSVKSPPLSSSVIKKAKLDYSNGVRNVALLNTLILYYLQKKSGNFIFKIYQLYKDHLSILYENTEFNEAKIQKVFSIIYEFAKLYLVMHFISNKSIKREEYDECMMSVVSYIAHKLEDMKAKTTSPKHIYFEKLYLVINYIQLFNMTTPKKQRLSQFIKDLYSKLKTSNKVIDLENKTEKQNYDACIDFLLDRSNHKFF